MKKRRQEGEGEREREEARWRRRCAVGRGGWGAAGAGAGRGVVYFSRGFRVMKSPGRMEEREALRLRRVRCVGTVRVLRVWPGR